MTAAAPKPALTEPGLADLRRSGLTDATIAAAGLRSVSGAESAALLGMKDVGPGLAFPYPGATISTGQGFARVKPDVPYPAGSERPAKYLSPCRRLNPEGNRLYVPATLPAGALLDTNLPLLVTEGEKKTLKANQEGYPTVGLAGVYAWLRRADDAESVPIGDLQRVAWEGRLVGIAFDSDAATNPNVLRAEKRLKRELRSRGAIVFVLRLPPPSPDETDRYGSKFGLDDFLVARGRAALEDLLLEASARLPFGARPVPVFLAAPAAEARWLIEDIWPLEGCGIIGGEPKAKKSWVVLEVALSVATGTDFLGREVHRGAVILFDEENKRDELKKRIARLLAAHEIQAESLKDLYIADQALLRLDDQESMEELEELVGRVKPTLLVLDPLVRLHQGDENDAAHVSAMLSGLRRLQIHHRCAVMLVHHLGKQTESKRAMGQRLRGSSDFHGWIDAGVYCVARGREFELSFESRYGVPSDPILARLQDAGEATWIELVDADGADGTAPPEASLEDRVLAGIREAKEPPSKSELAKALRCSGANLNGILESLVASGRVVVEQVRTRGRPKGVYRVAEDLPDSAGDSKRRVGAVRKGPEQGDLDRNSRSADDLGDGEVPHTASSESSRPREEVGGAAGDAGTRSDELLSDIPPPYRDARQSGSLDASERVAEARKPSAFHSGEGTP
jgi:hypothetical protein